MSDNIWNYRPGDIVRLSADAPEYVDGIDMYMDKYLVILKMKGETRDICNHYEVSLDGDILLNEDGFPILLIDADLIPILTKRQTGARNGYTAYDR